jgi:hypothetical protein
MFLNYLRVPDTRDFRILSLPLLVLLIRADHPHHAAAADDLAFVTNTLD